MSGDPLPSSGPLRQPPVAIVGMSCLFPKAGNLDEYWANIKNAVDAITDVPESHWRVDDYFDRDPASPDRTYARRGGFLSPVDFDPLEAGIAPKNLEAIDTSQLLGLVVARRALEDAGYTAARDFDRARSAVILGVTGTLELVIPLGARLGHPIWRRALRQAGVEEPVAEEVVQRISDAYVPWQENSFPGLLGNVVAGRIANRLDFGGTNCVVDAACASSLSALNLAILELTTGRADLALTGGVDTFNDVFMYLCFSKTPALSPTGDARPFDAGADGTILGEGIGMLVLRRLEDARRDGQRIYAVIRGIGSSSDGKGNAVYAPSANGQVRAIRRAYEIAGVTADTIDLVEAHGTGTSVGDATEARSLAEVFGAAIPGKPWCALGSVKSQIGHTKAAAGVAGVIKAALALRHQTLPPTIKVARPNEAVTKGDTPFYINTECRPWLAVAEHPRRAAVSAFGFGGSNFHCVLEEEPSGDCRVDWSGDVQILSFSAESVDELSREIEAFAGFKDWQTLRAMAVHSRRQFAPGRRCRLHVVAERERTDVPAVLLQARTMLGRYPEKPSWSTPDGAHFGSGPESGRLATLFPGQGSQYVGMHRHLACQFGRMRQILEEANAVVEDGDDGPPKKLSDYIYPTPAFTDEQRLANESALKDTAVAQPAIGAVSLGALTVLRHFGVRPEAVAGHSFGELTALCASQRFRPTALYWLSRLRGRLMAADNGARGAMLAVGAPIEVVEQTLRSQAFDLVIANRNAPNQVVLSGATPEIERAEDVFATLSIRRQRLPVSAAFHSPLVAASRGPFRSALDEVEFHIADVPVFANSTAREYPDDPDEARELLASQLERPVEFVTQIENIYQFGARTFLEVGPGNVLSGLVGSILANRPHRAIPLDASLGKRSGIVDLAHALAQLSALGHVVDIAKWDPDGDKRQTRKAGLSKRVTIPICGANYRPPRPNPPAMQPVEACQVSAVQELDKPMPHEPEPRRVESSPNRPLPPHSPNSVAADQPDLFAPPKAADVAIGKSAGWLVSAYQATQENLAALERMQRQTAELHREFLRGQEAALNAFQTLAEGQRLLLSGQGPGLPAAELSPLPGPALHTSPADGRHPVESRTDSSDASVEPMALRPNPSPIRESDPQQPMTSILSAEPHARAVSQTSTAAPAIDANGVVEVLLDVVAEKTGYPTEMLDLDMKLDEDLGIDSIKRVEILSALQERIPQAPEVKPEQLGTLYSLRDLAAILATISHGDVAGHAVIVDTGSSETASPDWQTGELDVDEDVSHANGPEKISAPEAPGTLNSVDACVEESTAAMESAVASRQKNRQDQQDAWPRTADRSTSLREGDVERLIVRLVDAPDRQNRSAVRLAVDARIWMVSDTSNLAIAVAKCLRDAGYRPEMVGAERADSASIPLKLDGLLFFPPDSGTTDAFLAKAFRIVRQVGPALRAAGRQTGAILAAVSRLDGSLGFDPDATLDDALSGGLAGLVKTARHEWPEVTCKVLDVPNDWHDESRAVTVVDEMLVEGPLEVALSRKGPRTVELFASPPDVGPVSLPLDEGDLVIVSGGARGVTAACTARLAEAFRPRLVLLGRSPKPGREPEWLESLDDAADVKRAILNRSSHAATPKSVEREYQRIRAEREIRRTLEQIQRAGAHAEYHSVDVRDANAVRALAAGLRERWGAVRGLIHGAGVIADQLIVDKTDEQFDRVYSTKVAGLRNLLHALQDDPLRILVLFSSFTGRFGRKGQVDYAVANEVLNKIAQQQARRRPACRVTSFNWGPWAGGMVTESHKALFADEGVGLILLESGANCLVQEISRAGTRPVEVVVLGKQIGTPSPSIHAAPARLELAFERELNVDEYPFLKSHVIGDRSVLPLCIMLEWLAHGAIHQNPGLALFGANDLRVFKGVRLTAESRYPLRILTGKAIQREGLFYVPVKLFGARGNRDCLHAAAEIVLSSVPREEPARPLDLKLDAYRHSLETIYTDLLFHGPDFHGIERVLGCSDSGIAAAVRVAPEPSAWIRAPLRGAWLADPLVVDCCFQLMVLWSLEFARAPSLPCAVGRYRQFRSAYPAEGVLIAARVKRWTARNALVDFDVIDGDQQLVARIEDYECVIDPALRDAFRRNQLPTGLVSTD